jgi:hypothetical protein
MAQALSPQDNKNLQSGLLNEGAISENLMPIDAVTESLNFHFDKIGSATLRKGTTLLGNKLSSNCAGLYEFRDSGSGTNNQIVRVDTTTLYHLTGTSWTSKRGALTLGSKARFTTFLDYLWMVNGTEDTAIWDGNPSNAFSTAGIVSGAPKGQFIENFRSRVWIAGNSTFPDRVYCSTLQDTSTPPQISWDTTPGTGNYVDISPQDGDNTTGMRRAKNALLVFKREHIYRIYSVSETEPDPKVDIGTYSNESIVGTKVGNFFHHPTGFYLLSDDGGLKEISKPIIDIVQAITVPNYDKITGWQDGDHVYWSVGDCTINGVSYANLVVRYTISTEVWTHYSYPTQFLFSSDYNDGTTIYQIVGDEDGNVLKVNTGNTDNGTNISYSLIHRWSNIDGLLSTRKIVNKILFSHTGGAGTNITWQKEGSSVDKWDKLGTLKTYDTGLKTMDVKCMKMRMRLTGSSKGEPFEYKGWEILEGQSELIQFI